jgi:hypothetical protein
MGPRLVSREGLLRRDNVDKGWEKGGLCLLFAAQRDDLCGQFHVVYPGRYNYSVALYLPVFTCRE